MSLSDKFYSDYSKIRTSLLYQFIPTKDRKAAHSKQFVYLHEKVAFCYLFPKNYN